MWGSLGQGDELRCLRAGRVVHEGQATGEALSAGTRPPKGSCCHSSDSGQPCLGLVHCPPDLPYFSDETKPSILDVSQHVPCSNVPSLSTSTKSGVPGSCGAEAVGLERS